MYHTADDPIRTFNFASNFDEEYDLGRQLGAGTFGTVYEAISKSTGETFAVKRMKKRFDTPDGVLERYFVRRIRNEVDICNHLGRSLNVAYMYAAYEDDKHIDLVMEHCTGGELWDAIRARGGAYNELDAARLVREVLRTVAQCHAAGVLMRDVKPENFLFASTEPGAPLKAIDFGISVFCEAGQEVDLRAGTPIYIAPDVLRCKYSHPADLWSVGVVAYMLLTGRLPFSGEEGSEVSELYMAKHTFHNKEVFRAVLYSDLDFTSPPWDVISPEAKDLVSSLLQRAPEARPTAEAALAHPWLCSSSSSLSSSSPSNSEETGGAVPLGDTIVQRLQRYGTYGRLKQAALRKVAHAVLASPSFSSDDSTTEASSSLPKTLLEAFQALDRNGTGRIPLSHLRAELRSGRFNLSDAEADQLLLQVEDETSSGSSSSSSDSDGGRGGDPGVDWEAWVAAMTEWEALRASTDWDALVAAAFKTMDLDADAALGADDLEMLLCGEEGCVDPDMVEAALREADVDHDGTVSLKELQNLLGSHDIGLEYFDPRVVFDNDKEKE